MEEEYFRLHSYYSICSVRFVASRLCYLSMPIGCVVQVPLQSKGWVITTRTQRGDQLRGKFECGMGVFMQNPWGRPCDNHWRILGTLTYCIQRGKVGLPDGIQHTHTTHVGYNKTNVKGHAHAMKASVAFAQTYVCLVSAPSDGPVLCGRHAHAIQAS